MIKPAITVPFLLLLSLACTTPNQSVVNSRKDFHLPVIVQDPAGDTIEHQKIGCINSVYFRFAGKSKFTDTLLLDKDGFVGDTIAKADILWEQSRPKFRDSLSTDGFQVFPDYNTSIYYKQDYYPKAFCYFPVYVVNETSSTKVFFEKDDHVFGIQEAVDASDLSDQWRPIEAQGPAFCENGDLGIKVHPGEFVMFLVPKYYGKEKNAMRIRLQVGESYTSPGLMKVLSVPVNSIFLSIREFNVMQWTGRT
jgi:hypothetical protein